MLLSSDDAGCCPAEAARRLQRGVVAGTESNPPARENGLLSDDAFVGLLRHHAGQFGITRVGELTGLDVLGIPVFHATRPNSRSLSTSQGKSLDPVKAEIGAIMEALEQAFAERADDLVACRCSRRDLARTDRECWSAARGDDDPVDWVEAVSMHDGRTVLVPLHQVGLDFRRRAGHRSASPVSTIGLAGGQDLASAVLHGLYEVIENDATRVIEGLGLVPSFIEPALARPGRHDRLDAALERVRRAGMECRFLKLAHRIPIPTIGAFLYPGSSETAASGVQRTFAGFACRHSAEDAALAALLEAAQSRLTQIAGSRDDMSADAFRPWPSPVLASAPGSPLCGFSRALPPGATATAILAGMATGCNALGLGDVLVVPLGHLAGVAHFSRVIVPDLRSHPPGSVVSLDGSALDLLLRRPERGTK